jgi:uncharacterized membrane protein
MNPVQLHLALNHFPIIGLFISLVILFAAFLLNTPLLRKVAYLILLGIGMLVPVIEWSGEESEELLEAAYEVSHKAIHTHEESGERAALLFYLLAMIAAVGFGAEYYLPSARRAIAVAVLLVGLASLGVSMYAAHSGGLIRHPELNHSAKTTYHRIEPGLLT